LENIVFGTLDELSATSDFDEGADLDADATASGAGLTFERIVRNCSFGLGIFTFFPDESTKKKTVRPLLFFRVGPLCSAGEQVRIQDP
jgi:hypothetical protein